MLLSTSQYERFERQYKIIYGDFINEYSTRLAQSREGYEQKAYQKFLNEVYDRHRMISADLGVHSRFFIDIQDELEDNKEKEFDALFNQKFDNLPDEGKQVVFEKLCHLRALNDLINFLHSITLPQI